MGFGGYREARNCNLRRDCHRRRGTSCCPPFEVVSIGHLGYSGLGIGRKSRPVIFRPCFHRLPVRKLSYAQQGHYRCQVYSVPYSVEGAAGAAFDGVPCGRLRMRRVPYRTPRDGRAAHCNGSRNFGIPYAATGYSNNGSNINPRCQRSKGRPGCKSDPFYFIAARFRCHGQIGLPVMSRLPGQAPGIFRIRMRELPFSDTMDDSHIPSSITWFTSLRPVS